MSLHLQKSFSIQPRADLPKLGQPMLTTQPATARGSNKQLWGRHQVYLAALVDELLLKVCDARLRSEVGLENYFKS